MIDETAVGRSSRKVSHCMRKSGGTTSPAVGGTSGPHLERNAFIRSSASGSRDGGGSGPFAVDRPHDAVPKRSDWYAAYLRMEGRD